MSTQRPKDQVVADDRDQVEGGVPGLPRVAGEEGQAGHRVDVVDPPQARQEHDRDDP